MFDVSKFQELIITKQFLNITTESAIHDDLKKQSFKSSIRTYLRNPRSLSTPGAI